MSLTLQRHWGFPELVMALPLHEPHHAQSRLLYASLEVQPAAQANNPFYLYSITGYPDHPAQIKSG